MKESFVFHSDFISDLPEDYKASFAMYAVKYGLHGEEPTLTGLELTLWLKIKRRIDSDQEAWEETKAKRSEAGKIGGIRSAEAKASKLKQIQANVDLLESSEANVSKAKQSQAKQAVNVNGNVNDSVSVYVYDGVNVSVGDSEESISATISKITEIQNSYNLDLTKTQISKIDAYLKSKNLDSSFLDYVCNYLLAQYKKVDSALFYKASTSWENLIQDFKPEKKAEKIPKLDYCPDCSSSLSWISDSSRFCGTCRKNYFYKNKKWRKE